MMPYIYKWQKYGLFSLLHMYATLLYYLHSIFRFVLCWIHPRTQYIHFFGQEDKNANMLIPRKYYVKTI